ncbi:hypothetical protein [Salinibacter sp.]|uniref:hypothetical protein n=1 Tax=Salinibacter sp. TaxID=2065818 RepID=UPI0023432127
MDLLVEFVPGEKSFDNFMAVSFLLEEEFGRPVALVPPEAPGSPHLAERRVRRERRLSLFVTSKMRHATWRRRAERPTGTGSPATGR